MQKKPRRSKNGLNLELSDKMHAYLDSTPGTADAALADLIEYFDEWDRRAVARKLPGETEGPFKFEKYTGGTEC